MMNSRSTNTLLAINKKDWQNLDNLTIKRITTEAIALGADLSKFNVLDVSDSLASHSAWYQQCRSLDTIIRLKDSGLCMIQFWEIQDKTSRILEHSKYLDQHSS